MGAVQRRNTVLRAAKLNMRDGQPTTRRVLSLGMFSREEAGARGRPLARCRRKFVSLVPGVDE